MNGHRELISSRAQFCLLNYKELTLPAFTFCLGRAYFCLCWSTTKWCQTVMAIHDVNVSRLKVQATSWVFGEIRR